MSSPVALLPWWKSVMVSRLAVPGFDFAGRVEVEEVAARPAGEPIATGASRENVSSRAAAEHVVAGSAIDEVVARPAAEPVAAVVGAGRRREPEHVAAEADRVETSRSIDAEGDDGFERARAAFDAVGDLDHLACAAPRQQCEEAVAVGVGKKIVAE